jgi:hypothetical protein
MPSVTRWFIKTSLVYLALSLGIAVWLATQAASASFASGLSAVFFHFFLVGWVTQMIMGVAYWFFPKYSLDEPRRSEPLAWAVFWLLNAGLLLRGLIEPVFAQNVDPRWGLVLTASAILQWLAGLMFVYNSWGRIKER